MGGGEARSGRHEGGVLHALKGRGGSGGSGAPRGEGEQAGKAGALYQRGSQPAPLHPVRQLHRGEKFPDVREDLPGGLHGPPDGPIKQRIFPQAGGGVL